MSLTLDELLAEVASAPAVTPADQDPRLGTKVGPYQVQERIGRGGMGTVYLARDTRLRRDVALKMLHDESPDACRELLREARRAATVSHMCIAQVFDVNEEAPPYIAMELVQGDSLHDRILQDPPGREESLKILGDVADAIGALHAQGIVHRDLTPRNIALTSDGRLKILDFGIAMPVEKSAQQVDESSILYAGTERYVAPERARGRAPTPKEDVFSFGVLADDLFGDSPPAHVAELLRSCRSEDETKRPADLRVVAGALHDAEQPPGPEAPKSKRGVFAFAALLLLLLGLLVALVVGRLPGTAGTDANTADANTSEANAADEPETPHAAPSPTRLTFYAEDQAILFLSEGDEEFLVTDTLGVSRYGHDNEAERLSLPDGFHAATAQDTSHGVLVLGNSGGEGDAYYLSGGEARPVPNEQNIDNLSVAPDGRHIAGPLRDTIVVGVLDDERRALFRPDSIRFDIPGALRDQRLSWSPDGRRLLVFIWQGGDSARLEELDVASGHRRTVIASPNLSGRLGTYASTYVDNETIAFSLRELDDASVGIYTLSLAGDSEPRLVTRFPTAIEDLRWCPTRGAFRFLSLDPDYKLHRQALNEPGSATAGLVAAPQRLTFSDHQDWVTGFSADGEDILFSRSSAEGSRAYSVGRSSPSSEVPLPLSAAAGSGARGTPTRALQQSDEAWLAFMPQSDGHHDLLRLRDDDAEVLAQVQVTPGDWRAPPYGAQVRRGGGRVFYGTSTGETVRLFEVFGGSLRPLFVAEDTLHNWFVFAVSQDGERFLYREPEGMVLSDRDGVVLRRFSGRGTYTLQYADFLRDGSLIVSAASTRQFSVLHIDVETGVMTRLVSSPHHWFGAVAASPARDEFAYTEVGWDTDIFEFKPAL